MTLQKPTDDEEKRVTVHFTNSAIVVNHEETSEKN